MKLGTLKELKHSRVFFDKQPPRFMTYFTWFVVGLLASSLYVTSITTKNYVVKGVGSVVSSDKVTFTSKVAGVIVAQHKKEGESVKKGDLLLTLSSGNEGIQSTEYSKQIELLKSQMNAQDIYERSLNEKKNYLQNMGGQQAYFGKVEYYLSQIQTGNENAKTQQEKIATKRKDRQVLVNKINTLSKDKQVNAVEIETKYQEIKTLDEEIKSLTSEVANAGNSAQSTYNQLVSELGTERLQVNAKKQELESQYQVQITSDEQLKIYASQNGVIHYNTPISVGSAVQQGAQIGMIFGGEEGKLQVETYIQAIERTKIQEGNDVKLAIAGLSQTKYGMLNGKVVSIGIAPLIQETKEGQMQVYQVIVELDTSILKQNKEEYQVYSGLQVESQIVYDKETYLDWILEQLNLKE
ncbi:MAG: HlyD family secretion protein [Culicoidibacterales bacterium]